MTCDLSLDRRTFVLASSLALAGCATCRIPGAGAGAHTIGDAHAHFFNLADLPVGNFVKYVFIPANIPGVPDFALALIDIATWVTKRLAKTAQQEIGDLDRTFGNGGEISADRFGEEIKQRQDALIAAAPSAKELVDEDPRTSLAASHLRLAQALGAAADPVSLTTKSGDSGQGVIAIDADAYSRIALGKDASAAAMPQAKKAAEGLSIGRIKATIKWIYTMIQPRCVHVNDYLNTINTPSAKVAHAINLLVDYDRWLGERPLAGSDHADQVAFWTRYSRLALRKGSPLQLHTFAGYDPLKHADERLSGRTSHFETMLDWVDAAPESASHRIIGFKLYPPMGFRPSSNRDFDVSTGDRAAREVRNGWQWGLGRIGAEIDASLDMFFRECARRDIPLLAHAANSQEAMSGAGAKASPGHWIERAKIVRDWGGNPLRVCLGHFRQSPQNFLHLVEILRLNKPAANGVPGARIYVDMSFDEDILRGKASDVLDFYAQACRAAGDDGGHVLFGSDWIMLGIEATAGNYLEQVHGAALRHDYWGSRADKLFGENLRQFLKLPAA